MASDATSTPPPPPPPQQLPQPGEEGEAVAAAFCGVGTVNGAVPSWAFTTPWKEDLVPFPNVKGAKTWTRVIGDEKRARKAGHLPLLVLHGGPGFGSAYLESLELLTSQDRQIAFYDQFGCGYSQLGSSPAPLSIPLLLDELAAVRKSFDFKEMHVLGHGTGGMLALEYLLSSGKDAGGVASVTLVSTPPSYARLVDDRRARLDALSPATRDTLLAGDDKSFGGYAVSLDATYREALSEYERAFVCRSRPATDDCVREAAAPASVASELCGSRTFSTAGKLAGWDLSDRLNQLTTPTMVMCGDSDEIFPSTARAMQGVIPAAELHIFYDSGSFAHIDAWEPFLETVDGFMKAHDPVKKK
eukprot:jgi/Chlat1/3305/Chrsp22S00252